MVNLPTSIQTLLTLCTAGVVLGGSFALVWVSFKSKLPGKTIEDLQSSNSAKETLLGDIRRELDTVKLQVVALQAENRVIKQLPLDRIADTQEKILQLLTTQNEILKSHPIAGSNVVNIQPST